MSYLIEERPPNSGKWWVFKENAAGEPAGAAKNKTPFPSKVGAEPYLRALYAAMHKKGGAVSELDLTLLSPSGAGFDPVYPQETVAYTPVSPHLVENARCGSCVFFSGANYCYLVANVPQPIVADGYCDQWTEIEMLADPAGTHEMTDEFVHEMAKDLPVAPGDPAWDAGATRERIWAWATSDKGEFDITKAAQAFLVRTGDTKGDLKDPIADVVDGRLQVIPAALRAASGGHGLPNTEGGKSGAAAVLAHYKKLAHIGELTRAALEDFVVSEYKGSVPEVPDAPGVDKKALTEGDPKPTFVIRPIAQVGRTSKNGILYDQALIDSIREQIVQNHPIGIFGHIKESDRSTAHPTPQAYWIGAKQYGDKLYAKAYIADMERAADIRRKKALNSADGTSIYGTGTMIAGDGGASLMRNFTLESLDFAPVDRASLDMGKEMYITSEMQADDNLLAATSNSPDPDHDGDNDLLDPNESNEKEPIMANDVIDPMVGLTANWKSMQPGDVCEQLNTMLGAEMMGKVAEAHLAKSKMKPVAMEMEVVDKGVVSEMQQQTVTIAELKAYKVNAEKREFENQLTRAIAEMTPCAIREGKPALATTETRSTLELKARLVLKDNTDVTQIAETVKAVVTGSPALMEMWRDAVMGPSAIIGGKDNHTPAADKYYSGVDVTSPEAMEAARKRVGV